jgi:hypothetical protein
MPLKVHGNQAKANEVNRLNPRTPGRRPLQQDGRCAASFSTLQRGAAHAPGPVR